MVWWRYACQDVAYTVDKLINRRAAGIKEAICEKEFECGLFVDWPSYSLV